MWKLCGRKGFSMPEPWKFAKQRLLKCAEAATRGVSSQPAARCQTNKSTARQLVQRAFKDNFISMSLLSRKMEYLA